MMRRRVAVLIAAVLVLAALAFWQQRQTRAPAGGLNLRGATMGTVYSVRTAGPAPLSAEALQALVDARLAAVNAALSTWAPDSEISRFNRAPANAPQAIGEDFQAVLRAALRLGEATDGAFDPTVAPLVELWGFGPAERQAPPTHDEIAQALRRIGFRHVRMRGGAAEKTLPGLTLDLSAIAKGYGVDAVARLLEAQGIDRYVVEIGGEVVLRGLNARDEPWAIGIERPVQGAPLGEQLQGVVRLERGALATSGSYRRYRRTKEGLSHHIVDPRTGRPTRAPLVAVTVLAPDCMTADGIATALMVLGVREGMAWLARRTGVSALFLEEGPDGRVVRTTSPGFPPIEAPQ